MKTLFVIDQDTCLKKLKNGSIEKRSTNKKFQLNCLDTIKGKDIIKPATEQQYLGEFYMKLIRVKGYELEDFLQFHYAGSSDKAKYLNILKALCKSELNRHPATKETVIDWLNSSVNKKVNTDQTIAEFCKLFANDNEFENGIEVLRQVAPPIIDSNGNYIKGEKSKGSMVAYIKVLEKKGKIPHVAEKDMAVLLNKQFPKLSITDRTLRSPISRSYNKYYTQFLAVIK